MLRQHSIELRRNAVRFTWLRFLSAVAITGALVMAGCGPSTTTVDEGETQSPEQYEEELEAEAASQFSGDVNLSKPEAKPEGTGESAAEGEPAADAETGEQGVE
jgi:hypothetical protein